MSHLIAEYLGRSDLAERQQKLSELIMPLIRIAQMYNVAIVLTNQVSTDPGNLFAGNPVKATGGNMLAHSTTYRIFVRKGAKNNKNCKVGRF